MMNRRIFVAQSLARTAALGLSRFAAFQNPSRWLILFGTRAGGAGKGISSCFFDPASGTSAPLTLAAEIASPTAFAVSRDRKILYSVSETGNDGKSNGSISAFTIDYKTGSLALLNSVATDGGGPTYLALDNANKLALTACFGSGRTNLFRILPDGRLGPCAATMQDTGSGPTPRQAAPHVHCTVFSPGNRFVLAAEFGADRINIFRLDAAAATLTPHDPPFAPCPAGSGPRQIVFHPTGRYLYLLSELTGDMTVFAWSEKDGTLTKLQTASCYAAGDTAAHSCAGLSLHPNGRFLFTTTRSDNSAEAFAISPTNGTLELRQRVALKGVLPWSCALDPAGRTLLTTNLTSNDASIYRIREADGTLTASATITDIPSPAAAIILAA